MSENKKEEVCNWVSTLYGNSYTFIVDCDLDYKPCYSSDILNAKYCLKCGKKIRYVDGN